MARPGAVIDIIGAMQYLKFGKKQAVNNNLQVSYCGSDGWVIGNKPATTMEPRELSKLSTGQRYSTERRLG